MDCQKWNSTTPVYWLDHFPLYPYDRYRGKGDSQNATQAIQGTSTLPPEFGRCRHRVQSLNGSSAFSQNNSLRLLHSALLKPRCKIFLKAQLGCDVFRWKCPGLLRYFVWDAIVASLHILNHGFDSIPRYSVFIMKV